MYDGRRWWNTDYVNYPESDARERLNEELLPLLPDELAALLVERTITQTVDGEMYTCTDKLWPLSAVEVFGEDAPDWMQRETRRTSPCRSLLRARETGKRTCGLPGCARRLPAPAAVSAM